jgi:DNA-binding transcriptional LysR family regulator
MSSRSWTFWNSGVPQAVAVHSRLVVNTAESAVDMAVAGLGLTRLLSYQIEAPLADGKLAIVLERFEPPQVPVSLVYGGAGLLPLKLRAFLDFALPRLKAKLAKDFSPAEAG